MSNPLVRFGRSLDVLTVRTPFIFCRHMRPLLQTGQIELPHLTNYH